MSDENNGGRRPERRPEKKRIKLPDGTWGVYMGETGGMKRRRAPSDAGKRTDRPPQSGKNPPAGNKKMPAEHHAGGETPDTRRGIVSRYSLSQKERLEAEQRKRDIREQRVVRSREQYSRLPQREEGTKKFYHRIIDRLHMWHLSISVNIDSVIKALAIGFMILVFALLQTTVFSKLRPFGAIPDLMLPLVIAIGISEGERWGGVSGLVAAFLIDCLASTGITLLPLLYVPCGFIAGVLGTYYLRDSAVIRVLFSVAAGVFRALFTVIYLLITYKSPDGGIVFGKIVWPEFVSTLVFSVIPHVVAWLAMKPFHKTRAERVD